MADQTPSAAAKPASDQQNVLEAANPTRTDLSWLTMERPKLPKAVAGPKGMRLRDIETAETMDVPDHWTMLNDTPRGSIPMKGPTLAASYTIFDKVDVWSENCIDLYEDAIYDRWSSATTIPWAEMSALPEVTEAAIDQICTQLSEQAYIDVQVISKWLEQISYGFKEAKNFLATYVFDRSRHTEAFRKRALANGGGLGIEGTGIYHRAILGSMKFPDLVLSLYLKALWTKLVCEAVADHARNAADRQLFSLAARDCDRHIAYQTGLVQFTLSKHPERAPDLHFTCIRHELQWVAEWERDVSFREALALTLSDNPQEGLKLVDGIKATWVRRYIDLLAQAGLTNRDARLHPKLKALIEEPATA